MPDFSRRLNEADAMFLAVEQAAEVPYAPVAMSILERSYAEVDAGAMAHLREVQARLLPAMRRRIARDRCSVALPRWVDISDYDLARQEQTLPLPGDGSLRAIMDWAAEWSRTPWDPNLAPWRTVYFEGFDYDGRAGCAVMVSQMHHSVIDGEGGRRLSRRLLQYEPDGPLPDMPPPVPPEDLSAFGRWIEGWAHEAHKLRLGVEANRARLRWAAHHPRAAVARSSELAAALLRVRRYQSGTARSSRLRRRSTRVRFDLVSVELAALKAGGKAHGGTVNDALMGAVSVALARYLRDHGEDQVPSLRTTMAVNTRSDADPEGGNQVIAVMMELPLHDDAATAVKACAEVARQHRGDRDVMWWMDRLRALANRLPRRLVVKAAANAIRNMDLQISNLPGDPRRVWIAGVESLRTFAFPTAGPGVAMVFMGARGGRADLGISTDPDAVPDPQHLVARLEEAVGEVCALGDPTGALQPRAAHVD